MLEHILEGTTNMVVYIKKMRCLLQTSTEKDLRSGNGFDIYNYHRRYQSLKNMISWSAKYHNVFKVYQDLS